MFCTTAFICTHMLDNHDVVKKQAAWTLMVEISVSAVWKSFHDEFRFLKFSSAKLSHQLLFLLQPHPEWWHAISCVCVTEEITAVSLWESLPLKTTLYDWEEEVERCLMSKWLISGSLPNRIVPHIGKDTVRQRSRNNILTTKKFLLVVS